MAIKKSPHSGRKYDDNFYETMPGGLYIDSNEMFPGLVDNTEEYQDGEQKHQVGNKMLRQSLILVGLLIAQIILFMLLINYTVNLG